MEVEYTPAHQRGFTLVQLLTTLGVALTLVSIGIPSWQNLIASSAVSGASNRMAVMLQLARGTAVYQRTYTTLCASLDGSECTGDYTAWHKGYLLFVDSDGDRQHDADEKILRIADAATPGVTIHSSSGRRSIRFSSDGAAWGSNVSLRFCSTAAPDKNRALIVYGSGRVRLADTLPDGSPITCDN